MLTLTCYTRTISIHSNICSITPAVTMSSYFYLDFISYHLNTLNPRTSFCGCSDASHLWRTAFLDFIFGLFGDTVIDFQIGTLCDINELTGYSFHTCLFILLCEKFQFSLSFSYSLIKKSCYEFLSEAFDLSITLLAVAKSMGVLSVLCRESRGDLFIKISLTYSSSSFC